MSVRTGEVPSTSPGQRPGGAMSARSRTVPASLSKESTDRQRPSSLSQTSPFATACCGAIRTAKQRAVQCTAETFHGRAKRCAWAPDGRGSVRPSECPYASRWGRCWRHTGIPGCVIHDTLGRSGCKPQAGCSLLSSAYLIYLGVAIWRSRPSGSIARGEAAPRLGAAQLRKLFRTGFLVGIRNPKGSPVLRCAVPAVHRNACVRVQGRNRRCMSVHHRQ